MNTKRHAANRLWPCVGILLATGCFPQPPDPTAAPGEASSALLVSPDTPAVQVRQIFASDGFTFAVKTDGSLWSWGTNGSGQLGLGDTRDRSTPTQATGISGISQFSTGRDHACALKTDGSLWCWGDNHYGQLGIGDYVSRSAPTRVLGVTSVSQILLGGSYTCVKKTDKSLWCWGGSPFGYDWGFGTSVPHEYLTDVASAVLGTIDHGCATKTDGSLWCWGHNGNGQVGVGSGLTDVGSPTQIAGPANLKQVALGYISSLALQNDGTLWTWGDGESGQLGNGSMGIKFTPVQITATAHFLQAGMGYNHACATRSGGALWCWGDNTTGQLGLGFTSTPYSTPIELTDFAGVSKLAVGAGYTCALKTDGSVWCWGDNRWGELGLGDTTSRSTPTKLTF